MSTAIHLVPTARLRNECDYLGIPWTGKSRNDLLTDLQCAGLYEINLNHPAKPKRIDTSHRKDDLSNVFLGNGAGFHEEGSNQLYIANSNTRTPLIGGDFKDKVVRIHNCFSLQETIDLCCDTQGNVGDLRRMGSHLFMYRGSDDLHYGWYPLVFGAVMTI